MSFFFPDKIIEIMCLFFLCLCFFLLGYAEGKILAVNRQIKKLYFLTPRLPKKTRKKKTPQTKQNTKKTTKTKQKKSEDDLRNSIEYLQICQIN